MRKVLLFLIVFLSFIPPVLAEDNKSIVINEIFWSGSNLSSSDEYLELRNLTDEDIDISGWILEGAGTSGEALVIPQAKVVPAKGYFLISNYSEGDKSILDIEADWVTSSISLSNSGIQYSLIDLEGNTRDIAGAFSKEPLAGTNEPKASMERAELAHEGEIAKNWFTAGASINIKEGYEELGTPKAENSFSPYLAPVKIADIKAQKREFSVEGVVTAPIGLFFENRFYIQDDTSGSRVRVPSNYPELKIGQNIKVCGRLSSYHSEQEILVVDLSCLEASNTNNVLSPKTITTEISGSIGSYVSIAGKISQTSGETFHVQFDSGEIKVHVKDSTGIVVPSKRVGDSVIISGIINQWDEVLRLLPVKQQDIKITPSKSNKSIFDLPISSIKMLPVGSQVITRGMVSVTPQIISNTYFYIQDENAGIQIYCWYQDYPKLKLGDYIEVFGELSEIYHEKRVKIKGAGSINILDYRGPPKPSKIQILKANANEGRLVTIRGRIVKTSGRTFYLSDGSATIKVYITALSNIKKPRTYKNDLIEVTGIISISKTGLRILPRYQHDLKLLWTKPKKEKVIRASTWQKRNLKKPYLVFKAEKINSDNSLFYLGLAIPVIGFMAFLSYLLTLKLKKNGRNNF